MEIFPQLNLINRASKTAEFYFIVDLFRGLFRLVPKQGRSKKNIHKKITGESVFASFRACYLRALICGNSFLGGLREIGLYSHDWADKNK